MFGIRFIKFDAMTYVIQYKSGKVKREGRGLSFWYYAPNTSIVAIPIGSDDAPFIFEETTSDFQTVTVQGQITYKIQDPKQLAELLDFTVNNRGGRKSEDYEKLAQRLVNEAQTATTTFLQGLNVREAIRSSKALEAQIINGLLGSEAVRLLGIEPLSVTILGVKPNPEMARALEAETREGLQQEADEAIYARRKFAVDQERTIKESELNTEIAVEEKKKQISEKKMEAEVQKAENNRKLREMKVAADISIEEERKQLIELLSDNKKRQAETEAYRLQKLLGQYKDMDWKTLLAINGKNDAKLNIALAFRELAENADKIGSLNITPDLLTQLVEQPAGN
ncbi:MAG: SPFH domain-containing protein [Bacteroidota bacterium]